MNNLYLDYEKGSTLGTKMRDDSKELNNLLNKFKELQEKLNGKIDSKIEEQYTKALLTNLKVMYKLSELIDVTGELISNVSSAYKKVEENGITCEE